MEIRKAMKQLGITPAQADALDKLDGVDNTISDSIFERAKRILNDGFVNRSPENYEEDYKVYNALHPLPHALSKDSERNLTFAGIDKTLTEKINVKEATIANNMGYKTLVLRSSDNFEIQIDITDKNYNPQNLNFWRDDNTNEVNISGIPKGSLNITGPGGENEYRNESVNFRIRNSEINIRCADYVKDRIAVDEGAKVNIITYDYADKLERKEDNLIKDEHIKSGTHIGVTENNTGTYFD